MNLPKMTLEGFTALLASDAPAPGGGSAAALHGAVGAALTSMVASLSVNKEKYREHKALNERIMNEAGRLSEEFLSILQRDTEAFNGVSAVFAMPRDTDEQKAERKEAMQTALKACTRTPYEMMCCVQAALDLTEQAVGRSNTNAVSDLGVAALSLGSAVQGAWLNVLINLGGIRDEAFAAEYRTKGQAILDKTLPQAERIYQTVLESL